VLTGIAVAAAGLVPWTVLSTLNATIRPDIPWAASVSAVYVVALFAWLGGRGAPRSSSLERRLRLRLWPPVRMQVGARSTLPVAAVVIMLVVLYVAWIGVSRLSAMPDLGGYPTTSYRWSMFIMGGVMSGAVEEAAYRGYMQTGLERVDPANAVLIMSLVFAASHVTHGLSAVLLLGPGLFAAALLYGALVNRTGTILPGILIHIVGDLAHTFFGVLRGDAGLLFVS
jgi:membrane protease YdiL (CAAX protease family)